MSARNPIPPIVKYMQMHDWDWLTADEILSATKCTQNDFDAIIGSYWYKRIIEQRNGKYRYIGSSSNEKRKCVELLKSVYPETLSGNEIQKRAGLGKNAGWIITRYADVLPIESIDVATHHGLTKQYIYVPDDERSLVEVVRELPYRLQRVKDNKENALRMLKKYPDIWFSASEISARLGMSSCNAIAQALIHIADEHIHVRNDPSKNKRYYCYSEKKEVSQQG